MAWLAANKDGKECIFDNKPDRDEDIFIVVWPDRWFDLPDGSIKKLTGKILTWEDEPIEI